MNAPKKSEEAIISQESLKDPREATDKLKVTLARLQEQKDPNGFLETLRRLTKAQGGMSELSKKIKINRQNLYRTFASTGNPKLRSLVTILEGLGYRLTIEPIPQDAEKSTNNDN